MLKLTALITGIILPGSLGLWQLTTLWGLVIIAGLVLLNYGLRGDSPRGDDVPVFRFTRVAETTGYQADQGDYAQ